METFYYDFYKIENFLRNFEREHKLTQLGFDETNFWDARTMETNSPTKEDLQESTTEYVKTQNPINREDTSPSFSVNVGDMLANQVNSKSVDLSNLPKPTTEVDLASILHQEARHVSSGEAVLDGFDLIDMGMEVTAVALKLLEQAKNAQHQKTLEKIVSLSKQLAQLETQATEQEEDKSNKNSQDKNRKVSNNQIDIFIKDAISYLEQRTEKLENSLSIKSNQKKLDSQINDDDKQLALIQKRLELIDNKLAKQSSTNLSITADKVFSSFQKYFNSVDNFSGENKKEKYQVKSKTFGEINLDSSENNQSISLVKDNVRIYYAEFQNNQWQELDNTLSDQQINKIENLPQSKEQVAKNYSGKYLANFLRQKLPESGKIEKTIKWKFDDENERTRSYDFKIAQTSNKKQISIVGKDENNTNIFRAEIQANGLVNVINNQIPVQRINKLIDQQYQENQHQEFAESNTENLARKTTLKLKRSR